MSANRHLPDEIAITLSPNEWGQVLDGLEVLIEDWENTATYHEFGFVEMDDLGVPAIIRECNSEREAGSIASFYRPIRDKLQAQYDAASGAA